MFLFHMLESYNNFNLTNKVLKNDMKEATCLYNVVGMYIQIPTNYTHTHVHLMKLHDTNYAVCSKIHALCMKVHMQF